MQSLERFSFAGPDVRLRTSTVEGLSNTASFCIETRVVAAAEERLPSPAAAAPDDGGALSPLGW
jgi:hypothetical protein